MVVSLVTFITNVAGKFYYLFCRMNILHMVWQEMLCTKQLVTNPTLETFVRLIQVIFIVFIFSENIFLFSIFFKFTSTWYLKFYQLYQQKASMCKNYVHSSMQGCLLNSVLTCVCWCCTYLRLKSCILHKYIGIRFLLLCLLPADGNFRNAYFFMIQF